ncbi:MAG: hypothetical protein RL095_3427 [Verrucomicrobiota bacterium]|jgi:pSer/pThr/pTyr-binding forkhead associated (FHA) protein
MSDDLYKTTITMAIRPGTTKVNPLSGAASNKELKPAFFVLEKGQVRKVEIDDDHFVYTIGKDPDADIRISDGSVAGVQVSCVKFGDQWFFMDCGPTDNSLFDGISRRQVIIRSDARLVIKVGSAWVIYCGLDSDTYNETDSVALRRSLLEIQGRQQPDSASVTLRCLGQEQTSSAAPILVGSHESCDFRLRDSKLPPFAFVLYWNQKGLFIEDLTLGNPGLEVSGQKLIGSRLINDSLDLTCIGLKFRLEIHGVPSEQAEEITSKYSKVPRLTLTNTSGQLSSIILMPARDQLSIGRSPDARICIPDPSVSRLHAYITVKEKQIMLQDNQSSNKTFVNLKEVQRAILRAGDIVEFGSVPFLVHYEAQR